MMNEDKQFLSLEEVAKLLDVKYQLIYRLVRSGELPAVRVGRVYRVERADLDAYLERSKTGSGGTTCSVCGSFYRSMSSFPGVCEECGEPICTDCWRRLGVRRCAKHGGSVEKS